MSTYLPMPDINTDDVDLETKRIFEEWQSAFAWEMERARQTRGWSGKEFGDFFWYGTLPEREMERAKRKPGWSDKEFRDFFWCDILPEESEHNHARLE